ncbi:MAG: hypothetical protein AAB263_10245 [Planctomycetota bacterium]
MVALRWLDVLQTKDWQFFSTVLRLPNFRTAACRLKPPLRAWRVAFIDQREVCTRTPLPIEHLPDTVVRHHLGLLEKSLFPGCNVLLTHVCQIT